MRSVGIGEVKWKRKTLEGNCSLINGRDITGGQEEEI